MKIVPLQHQLENLQCLQKSDLDRMASLLTEEKKCSGCYSDNP